MEILILLLSWVTQPAQAEQLDPIPYAQCLGEAGAQPMSHRTVDIYEFGLTDFLLPYLAVYSGDRLPAPIITQIQQIAHWRWAQRFESAESCLAERLAQEAPRGEALDPGQAFAWSHSCCLQSDSRHDDLFCAGLVAHNVFRTLGRYPRGIERTLELEKNGDIRIGAGTRDYNPEWFRSQEKLWIERSSQIAERMISIRKDGGGDKWGEWYHSFGVMAYTWRSVALGIPVSVVKAEVRASHLIAPAPPFIPMFWGPKSQIDLESIRIAVLLHRGVQSPTLSCRDRDAYLQ